MAEVHTRCLSKFSRPDGANDYWKSEAVDSGQLDLFLSHSVLVFTKMGKSSADDGDGWW